MREFEVFGRRVLVERTADGWRAMHPGDDGKRRPAEDLPIPPGVLDRDLETYLEDPCHEWAEPGRSEVRRLR